MNRFLIPAAAAALLAGCAMPGIFGQQSSQPVEVDSAQTVVVREIYHETPVYYVDTVYMAEEPAPVQPVYVENEYNEYNEYNETNVYVRQRVVTPDPHRQGRGWSPRGREQQPRDRSGYDRPRERGDSGSDSDQPNGRAPKPPVKKTYAPATNDRQKSPVPPTKPTPPSMQAPARGGSVQVTQVQNEAPKPASSPTVVRSVNPESDSVQVKVGVSQTGTGLLAARTKK